jgi:hypothetical protein
MATESIQALGKIILFSLFSSEYLVKVAMATSTIILLADCSEMPNSTKLELALAKFVASLLEEPSTKSSATTRENKKGDQRMNTRRWEIVLKIGSKSFFEDKSRGQPSKQLFLLFPFFLQLLR